MNIFQLIGAKLFGWKYVMIDHGNYIRRVKFMPSNGRAYIEKVYGRTLFLDSLPEDYVIKIDPLNFKM